MALSRSISLGLAALFFTGCMASNGLQYEAAAETNTYHIAKIRKGMSEKEVLQIMRKPYSYESFETEEAVYDVWFYVTRATGLDQTRMVPQNLTPLTFKNGVLVGTGYSWYYYAMKEQAQELAAKNPESEKAKNPDLEDIEFEKALKNFKQNQSAPAPQPAPATPSQTPVQTQAQVIPDQKKLVAVVQKKQMKKVALGMNQAQVTNVLGSPDDIETYEVNGDLYDVWFYGMAQSQKTIPLTFKNGNLIGRDQATYQKVKQQGGIEQIDGYDRQGDRMLEDESEQNFDYW